MKVFLTSLLFLCTIFLNACGSGSSSNSGSSSGGNTPQTNTQMVVIGNITPLPLNGSSSNLTSVVVNNNVSKNVILTDATINKNGKTTDILNTSNSMVDVSTCKNIQANGSCDVQLNLPSTATDFLLNLKYKDSTGKTYSSTQIITSSTEIPDTNGIAYSAVNNNVYNYVGSTITLSIPFRLTKTFSKLDVKGSNPSFGASYVCPGNALTSGTLCTAFVVINNLGTANLVSGSIAFSGTSAVSINKTKNHPRIPAPKNLQSTILSTMNVTVSQNLTGNLLTSAINQVVNPSDGTSPQTITLLNNGSATITGITISAASPITVTNTGVGSCGAISGSLASGTSCTFTVNVNSNISGQAPVTVNYSNGASSGNTNGTLSFNVIYISAIPSVAMTMTSGTGNLTNTSINTSSYYTIVVKNTSTTTTNLSNITFTNPNVYNSALSWDSSSSCPTDGTASLNQNQSCTLVIKFSPTSVISSNTLKINSTANYTTSTGGAGTYTSASISTTYSSINSSAFLYLTPNSVTYSIRADGSSTQTQTYTVTNAGGIATTPTSIAFSATITGLSITGGTCNTSSAIAANGGTCTIITQYGPVSSAQASTNLQLNVAYITSGTSSATSYANITVNSSIAALITVNSITVTNNTSGSGTSSSPYTFLNSPVTGTPITIVINYKNIGTDVATGFNVALNGLPYTYFYNSGTTTCNVGTTLTSNLAAGSSCNVSIFAVNTNISNPYSLTGTMNVNIPGYSYTDASTSLNTNTAPTFSAYGGNTIYVTANSFAGSGITTNNPTSSTATAGGSFNVTFTASGASQLPITIAIPGITTTNTNLIYATTANTCSISTANGSCSINLTNQANSPKQIYYYNYTITPSGATAGSGITQSLNFTLN